MKKNRLLSIFSLQYIVMSLFTAIALAQSGPVVQVANGELEGVWVDKKIQAFRGIPYAAPPVGAFRWREPQPVKDWEGVRAAKNFGPRAMQTAVFGDMGFRSDGMSEDCLYLNVWAPAQKAKKGLPVLVYFYGGGFVAGDGSEARYDGEQMAREGIVAITVNYRLGVFGFMSHPELSKESPHHASGNYGLLDQAAALEWVKENIAAFGGDPEKITIAGESAGSVSVSAQMASPLSRDLIAGAIGESGSLLGTLPAVPLKEGEKTGEAFAQNMGAASLAALREMKAEDVLQAAAKFGVFRFSMTVDGYFFPKDPLAIYTAGEQAHVPLLAGWNSEEMNFRMVMGAQAPTKANFEAAVKRLYGNKAGDVLEAYNPPTDADVEEVATALSGDRFIAFSTWRWTDLQAQTTEQPVYRYFFERARPAMTAAMGDAVPGLAGGVQKGNGNQPPPAKGAVHSAEIEYAMGNLASNKVYAWTKEDYKVSRIMMTYFANFIKTGNPNGKGVPTWPTVSSATPPPVLHINVDTKVEPALHEDRYHLLEEM